MSITSILGDFVNAAKGVSMGAVDVFKGVAEVQAIKQSTTLNDLKNQVSLLTMQRDLQNDYLQATAQNSAMNAGNLSRFMPLLAVGGVALVALMLIKK